MDLFMEPLKRTLSILFNKTFQQTINGKNNFIIYKIVDSHIVGAEEYYKIQYINTKVTLDLRIEEIVFDLDILHGLHPIQGCFVGIEYAKIIKKSNNNCPPTKTSHLLRKYSTSRYGDNNLLYQDRSGQLGFQSHTGDEIFIMDPRDIVLSKELIEEFDVAQAFCIGVLAGLKFSDSMTSHQNLHRTHSYLRLVKG